MLLGELEDVLALSAGVFLFTARGAAKLEIERLPASSGGSPSNPPCRSISASKVSCGENPALTSLALGGAPLL